ncbi:MAG: carbohydrate kinase [Lachnospiraceae bacterium]|nr:carbohydrate kinase [Lachnospiraceae bacterium]
MKKLLAIGEALIDFIPQESGKAMKDVSGFSPAVGGAPANVCGAYRKLGGEAGMITQLGQDPFGDKIVEAFQSWEIDCSYLSRTTKANTSLAFVALKEDGNREFSFYRKPGADMLLEETAIQKEWFTDTYALHFCSVSLGDFPMKQTHKRAIAYATQAGAIISFDPNLRMALWEKPEDLKKAVLEFLPLAHIVKISDEELSFLTGKEKIEDALPMLFKGNVKLVIFTKGADGSEAYTANAKAATPGYPVKAFDTTGAGDAFIGSFLYQLSEAKIGVQNLDALTAEQMEAFLDFSSKYCSKSVLKAGAIASYPTRNEMKA